MKFTRRTSASIVSLACSMSAHALDVKPIDAQGRLFLSGYEAYLSGRVAEGVRKMEQADVQGVPGARQRLCAIYAKPDAAQGGDAAKFKARCAGLAPAAASAASR